MSDDKKRDRALQRRVRERQAKTGESYQAAWRQLTDSEPPKPDETQAEMQDKMQGDEIEPAEKIEEPSIFSSKRLIIPFQFQRVPPRQPTRVAARATNGAVEIEQLHISGAATPGGLADWIVNDVEIEGRSQLTTKDLPGALFGHSNVRASFNGFETVERDHELALVVTYVGPNPEGAALFAAVMGIKPAQRPTVVPIAAKDRLPPTAKATIRARVQNSSFQVARVTIQHGDTAGGSADWIVNDIRIGGKSQFIQSGDIPGDLFATNAIDVFVKLDPCKSGNAIEIDVTYIGLDERGAIFIAQLEGTVLRDDYSSPPPDLHVLVETAGQEPGTLVVGTCNWRAPATDNRTR